MKKMNTAQLCRICILLVFSLLAFACKKNDDDNAPPEETPLPNVVELAKTVNVLSDLVAALEIADGNLVATLSANGQNTVFAPTNDAFDNLFAELEGFDDLSDFDEPEEKALLAEILKYHVVRGTSVFSNNISNGAVLKTLQNEELTISIDGSIFIQDATDIDAEVVGADNEALNGVVHIIDKILLPQAVLDILAPKPSIVELVAIAEDLSLLEEAVIKADLIDTLNGEGPFTVFAPSNAAIQELFDLLGDQFNSFDDFNNPIEIEILKRILTYHVVEGTVLSNNLKTGAQATLLTGDSIEVIASGDTFVIGDASATDANILTFDQIASNGVIHIIDKILIPAEIQTFLDDTNGGEDPTDGTDLFTIKELVEASDELSFLKDALELTGLLETLDEEGPFTAFAPANGAIVQLFALLGEDFNGLADFDTEYEIGLLRDVLKYHLLSGQLNSGDLTEGTFNTLSENNTIEVLSKEGTFVLLDATGFNANFLTNDIAASNGVIHVIDRILVPKSVIEALSKSATDTLVDILVSNPELDMALKFFLKISPDIESLLNRKFTFFFPTNQAFLDLFASLEGYDSIEDFNTTEEVALLARILSYHCVEEVALASSDLTNDQLLDTFQGEQLQVRIENGVFLLDKTGVSAKIIEADRSVLRGVVHVVDKVLLPQEIIDALSL